MALYELYDGAARDFASLRMFPVFETVHYIAAALIIREDKGACKHLCRLAPPCVCPFASLQTVLPLGSAEFAKRHPLASIVGFVLCCTGGSLTVDLILGLPLATPFLKGKSLITMIAVWYVLYRLYQQDRIELKPD